MVYAGLQRLLLKKILVQVVLINSVYLFIMGVVLLNVADPSGEELLVVVSVVDVAG